MIEGPMFAVIGSLCLILLYMVDLYGITLNGKVYSTLTIVGAT